MSETTQDSVNARIMQALHPTWINMGGYFNDGAGHGYVTPDFEHSVDASLAALPENFHVHIEPYHDGYLTGIINPAAETSTLWQGEGATRAEALARATLAWAQRQEG